MKIIIGSDKEGFELKEHLKEYLQNKNYQVIDKTPEKNLDFVESTNLVVDGIIKKEGDRGIVIDKYGQGSFMVANKHKGIICAVVSDEHSAKMTREHNSACIVSMGSGIVGQKLAEEIVNTYLNTDYTAGRHQIRIDMLNKML